MGFNKTIMIEEFDDIFIDNFNVRHPLRPYIEANINSHKRSINWLNTYIRQFNDKTLVVEPVVAPVAPPVAAVAPPVVEPVAPPVVEPGAAPVVEPGAAPVVAPVAAPVAAPAVAPVAPAVPDTEPLLSDDKSDKVLGKSDEIMKEPIDDTPIKKVRFSDEDKYSEKDDKKDYTGEIIFEDPKDFVDKDELIKDMSISERVLRYYKVYPTIINKLLENKDRDITQLSYMIKIMMIKIIENMDSIDLKTKNIYLKNKSMITMMELYDRVYAKYSNEYFNVSPYTGGDIPNIKLININKIMIHVCKTLLCSDYKSIILSILINSDTNKDSINDFINYCDNEMPELMIKHICKIFDNEYEDETFSMTTEDILLSSFNKIEINSDKMRETMEKIKPDIIKYYKLYFNTIIAEMHNSINNELNSILQLNKQLKILRLFIDKL